jgi:formylglycine-generating enzyme required for sulfatase activity
MGNGPSSTPLICVHLLVRVLGVSAFLAVIAPAAEWRVHAQWNHDGLVRFTTENDHTVAGPEPIVRWQASTPKLLRDGENSATLALTPAGLIATVTKGTNGQYGELVFTVDLRNEGKESATGAVLPPLSQWRDSADSISAHSAEFLMITAATAEIGSLGVHRSWSPGAEFEADTFVTRPDQSGRGHISAVLLMRLPPASHNREQVTLKPGESCRYELHVEAGDGGRNQALNEVYRVRGGYRVTPSSYNFTAYNAPDTRWAKDVTAVWMNWAWDQANMDPRTGAWRLSESLDKARKQFGGFDAYIFWPFWPRAGYDDRSQFEHYADLPGGIPGLTHEIDQLHKHSVHVFLSYCHWSESDRDSSPKAMQRSYAEFANLACEVKADGALMDLMSKTPEGILDRARQCGRTLVPYNEGDPTWSDSQTNLLGRIHNDLPTPEFNLKRYMLPHHAQLRVCEPGNSGRRMRNDFVVSFFNGHGVEINTMFPLNNPDNEPDWAILARALDILRTHHENFASSDWQPLVASEDPAVWINEWPGRETTIYTFRGTNPNGHRGPLFRVSRRANRHYIDLWRYRPITAQPKGAEDVIPYSVEGFTPGLGSIRGTADDSPGSVGVFPRRLHSQLQFEMLHVETEHAQTGEHVEVWLDTVSPEVDPVTIATTADLDIYQAFHKHTNQAIVLRLVNKAGQVEDVDVIAEESVRFFRIDKPAATDLVKPGEQPRRMLRIPGDSFVYRVANSAPDSQYPYAFPPFGPTYAYLPGSPPFTRQMNLKAFWIDKYPVTNREYAAFVAATGYHPQNDSNFLRQFVNGRVPNGLEDHPVVYVSYSDAKAYAQWVGKRLPTEEEWQLAAGAADGRDWPWGNAEDTSHYNASRSGTQPVNAHPSGASPYGVEDLVGNVWQWTASLMDNGRHFTVMLRGGSWYVPPKGRWWTPGGPRRITENYPLPLAGPSMNRLATVGFRCVKDE